MIINGKTNILYYTLKSTTDFTYAFTLPYFLPL